MVLFAPIAHASQKTQPATTQLARSFGLGLFGGALFGSSIFTQDNIPPHAGKFLLGTSLAGGLLSASYTGLSLISRHTNELSGRTQNLKKQVKQNQNKLSELTKKTKILKDVNDSIDKASNKIKDEEFSRRLDHDKIKLSMQKYGKPNAYKLKSDRYQMILASRSIKMMLADPYANQQIIEFITSEKNSSLSPIKLNQTIQKRYAAWKNELSCEGYNRKYHQFDPWQDYSKKEYTNGSADIAQKNIDLKHNSERAKSNVQSDRKEKTEQASNPQTSVSFQIKPTANQTSSIGLLTQEELTTIVGTLALTPYHSPTKARTLNRLQSNVNADQFKQILSANSISLNTAKKLDVSKKPARNTPIQEAKKNIESKYDSEESESINIPVRPYSFEPDNEHNKEPDLQIQSDVQKK